MRTIPAPTRLLIAAMLAAALGISVSACDTMEGLGEDTEDAGEALQDESQDVEEDMTE